MGMLDQVAVLEYDRFVRRLLKADWEGCGSALRLAGDLPLGEVGGAPIFKDARLLLRALVEAGGTPATVTGNLNRALVRQLFPHLTMTVSFHRYYLEHRSVFNEREIHCLHMVRVVCELAQLIVKRKRRFSVPRRAQSLLADAKAGELYTRLFLAHFRRLNLNYRCRGREISGIQPTLAVTLWRLGRVAQDWVPMAGLAEAILLPVVFAEVKAASQYIDLDCTASTLWGFVLGPLCDFGLLDVRQPKGRDWPGIGDDDAIRVTPLFGRFLRFNLQSLEESN